MRLHRFILDEDLSNPIIKIKEKNLLNQLKNVFRLKKEDSFIICDGKGKEATYQIIEISKNEIKAEQKNLTEEKEEKIKIHLYLSVLKKENFELAVQKTTECGVYSITPIITKRTIKTSLKQERLEKIAKEAVEQSGRFFLTKINKLENYENSIKKAIGKKIIFDKDGIDIKNLKEKTEKEISIFIGPEGGFTEEEIKMAIQNNFEKASLGKLTLRAETASIIATYLAKN